MADQPDWTKQVGGAVTISSGTVTIDTSGGAVSVSGSVSITGTATVSVSNVPAVTISGTPTVNINTGQSVSISGTVTVAFASAQLVTISGTPAVTISGTPAVTISGTATVQFPSAQAVTISGTPSVSISGTVTVAFGSTQNVSIQNASIAVINASGTIISTGTTRLTVVTGHTIAANTTYTTALNGISYPTGMVGTNFHTAIVVATLGTATSFTNRFAYIVDSNGVISSVVPLVANLYSGLTAICYLPMIDGTINATSAIAVNNNGSGTILVDIFLAQEALPLGDGMPSPLVDSRGYILQRPSDQSGGTNVALSGSTPNEVTLSPGAGAILTGLSVQVAITTVTTAGIIRIYDGSNTGNILWNFYGNAVCQVVDEVALGPGGYLMTNASLTLGQEGGSFAGRIAMSIRYTGAP